MMDLTILDADQQGYQKCCRQVSGRESLVEPGLSSGDCHHIPSI